MKKETIVAIIGGGGRESALVEAYALSPVDKIIAFPGNDLMKLVTRVHGVTVETFPGIETTNVKAILRVCQERNVALVDVCQDDAVKVGLVNHLHRVGIPVVGPTREAGRLEWDKAYAREFGKKVGLPQPEFKVCNSPQEGFDFINNSPAAPRFIKASGLAEGKGALPAKNNQEALKKIIELQKRFPDAAKRFLIEEWLKGDDETPGEEFSTFIITDGERWKMIGSAQDHKRVFDNDEGENTGGMGCSSPPLVLTPEIMQKVKDRIIDKTIKGVAEEGNPYTGILYVGGMLVKRENKLEPYVVEFNSRWGDPEAQIIIPGLRTDFLKLSMAVAGGNISSINAHTDGKSRVVVTGATRGYPGKYPKKLIINGIQDLNLSEVGFYPAAIKEINGQYFTNGGRLFYIVGEGENIIEARQMAYSAMAMLSVDGNNLHYRSDIGWRDVDRFWAWAKKKE